MYEVWFTELETLAFDVFDTYEEAVAYGKSTAMPFVVFLDGDQV